MKAFNLFAIASLSLALVAPTIHAQSARQLTRRVVPQPANQPPARQTAPAPAATRPPAVAPAQPAVVPAPVDPEKEKAKQAEALKKTIEFQKKRAEEGSPSAQYELGVRYLKGDGLEKDAETGRKWLEKSAQQDYSPAKKKLEELNEEKKK
jgi:TPR repeat protein